MSSSQWDAIAMLSSSRAASINSVTPPSMPSGVKELPIPTLWFGAPGAEFTQCSQVDCQPWRWGLTQQFTKW
ncbi:hypothetical protein GCM10028799_04830 [Kribbella italica]